MFFPGLVDHLFFALVGVYLPLSNLQQARRGFGDMAFDAKTKTQIYYSNGLVLWLGAFLALGIWWFNDRPFVLLGFQPPVLSPAVLLLTMLFVILYAFDTFFETQFAERRKKTIARFKKYTPFMPVNKEELQHFNFLALSAGIAEEIVFRGFFITYWVSIFGESLSDWFWAVMIPAVIFAIGHSYQGWKAVLKVLLLSVLFGYIFLLSQSLWIVIALHIAVDLISGRVIMNVMSEHLKTEAKT